MTAHNAVTDETLPGWQEKIVRQIYDPVFFWNVNSESDFGKSLENRLLKRVRMVLRNAVREASE